MIARVLVAAAALALGCGGRARPTVTAVETPTRAPSPAERLIALLPDGAQLVVELDLARLRANPVVGKLVERVLDGDGAPESTDDHDAEAAAARGADLAVFGAYGLGTSQAATILLVRAPRDIPGATRVATDTYTLGPTEWIAQIETRAALDEAQRALPDDLRRLRDRSMPEAAPGASVRVTARLSFDARIALARITGLENAPSQVSAWGDVADDFAIIIDADASDPGERSEARAVARLERLIRGALADLAADPRARAVGLTASLAGARIVARGTWVRTIIAVGPRRLQRVVERALSLMDSLKESEASS
jgi:hypothetical protein